MTEEKGKSQTMVSRPPIVVVLGHVDSGKTSILDAIRKAHVAEKESGGITQHVGAYEVEFPASAKATAGEGVKKITFIDTPGHEAFSAMRSRGAKVADIAVLVIDAVAGVQPQTKEAIGHIKKAGISPIVAINKIDIPAANPERIKQELMKEDIKAESFGGKIPVVELSAKTGKGISQLLEMILLVAEMENLCGDSAKPVEAVVVEAYLDKSRGPLATLILRDGHLAVGEIIATPTTYGKIKGLENFQGLPINEAQPAMPVVVLGLESVPQVGDKVKVFASMEEAQLYLQKKEKKSAQTPVIFIEEGKKVLNLILKADVQGSLEAIEQVLSSLPQDKVVLRFLDKEVGEINDNDIKLAKASKAVILGFRVKANQTAAVLQERLMAKVLLFDIIYNLAQSVRQVMESLLQPETERKFIGKVKVLALFHTEKNRQVIGGKVIEGEAKKGAKIEVWRNEQSLGLGRLVSLQENKKDISNIGRGRECGILFEGELSIEEGDVLELFEETRVKAEL